jgi:hypothetical protein
VQTALLAASCDGAESDNAIQSIRTASRYHHAGLDAIAWILKTLLPNEEAESIFVTSGGLEAIVSVFHTFLTAMPVSAGTASITECLHTLVLHQHGEALEQLGIVPILVRCVFEFRSDVHPPELLMQLCEVLSSITTHLWPAVTEQYTASDAMKHIHCLLAQLRNGPFVEAIISEMVHLDPTALPTPFSIPFNCANTVWMIDYSTNGDIALQLCELLIPVNVAIYGNLESIASVVRKLTHDDIQMVDTACNILQCVLVHRRGLFGEQQIPQLVAAAAHHMGNATILRSICSFIIATPRHPDSHSPQLN